MAECHAAGIAVKMITGDHAGTAAAIGRQIGLKNPGAILTGADIEQMDDSLLAIEALGTNIFARTTPAHKLRLVKALQENDMIVAMTGDGVNDAPALKTRGYRRGNGHHRNRSHKGGCRAGSGGMTILPPLPQQSARAARSGTISGKSSAGSCRPVPANPRQSPQPSCWGWPCRFPRFRSSGST